MNPVKTIKEVKEIFRKGNSLIIDELKDPYKIRRYLYRCNRINILSVFLQDNNFIIYSLNKK
jgi:hypothetical protein